jgi:hypothetical protein
MKGGGRFNAWLGSCFRWVFTQVIRTLSNLPGLFFCFFWLNPSRTPPVNQMIQNRQDKQRQGGGR